MWAHQLWAKIIHMEDCSPKTPRVGLMWRGTGEHNRPGTQEVNTGCHERYTVFPAFHGNKIPRFSPHFLLMNF